MNEPLAAGGASSSDFRAIGVALAQPPAPLAQSLKIVETAEAAGFDILGVGDLLADSLTYVGALTQRSRSAELFTSVAGWTRTPVSLALSALTAAELSGGRFRLGLGPMPQAWSENWHGIDYAQPIARMRDYVAAVRAACSTSLATPAGYAGTHYEFTEYTRLAGPGPHIPIYLGATRPGMTRLVGEVGDGLIVNAVHTVSWLRDVQLPALAAGLDTAGRSRADVDVGALVLCAIDDNEAAAAELVRSALSFYFLAPYFQDILEHHGFEHELREGLAATQAGDRGAAARAVSDELLESVTVFGTPERVRQMLQRYRGLADWLLLSPPLTQNQDVARSQLERILAELTPDRIRTQSR